MKTKAIIGATLLMLVASAMPVGAYHISTTTANEWNVAIPFLIICESDGALDPRNPNQGGALPGNGGLCTSGLNPATVGAGSVPTSAPSKGDFTRFDLLSDVMANKNVVGYEFQMGATACSVAPTEEIRYQELYAWWNYDDAAGGPGFHGHVAAFVDFSTTTPGVTAGEAFVHTVAMGGTFSCGSNDPPSQTPVHKITA